MSPITTTITMPMTTIPRKSVDNIVGRAAEGPKVGISRVCAQKWLSGGGVRVPEWGGWQKKKE